MIQFRERFIEVSNIDPLQYVTIASVVMAIMRSDFLKTKEIAVVKDITRQETFSKVSIKWLDYLSETTKTTIQHALNGGEHVIDEVGKVDGYCKDTNTVYEFQGCFWHGCPKCYSGDTINPKNQIDMAELNKRTIAKNKKIEEFGYNLVTVYECELTRDFKKWDKANPKEFVEPLEPRDSFFGGRTNVSKLKYDFKEGEKGRYVDYVSLYPTVQYFKRYPVGHPNKINDPSLLKRFNKEWFGFIKCKVEPPRHLYHPVLPVRTKCGQSEKLLFHLCRTCSESQQQETCEHTSEERSFIGTWCTIEVLKAIEMGYIVHKTYEVWDFDETTTEMWKGYIRKFLKIKMESTKMSFGSNCTYKSEEEFKKSVKNKLGIELGVIKFNPGMRAIAKLCLNSLWGKFGQRTNMTQTKYVTDLKEYYKILLDDTLENLDIVFLTEEMVQMNYTLKDQFVDNHNNTNVFIASFTTSHARLMLYDKLEILGDSVLGYDTDSVWYIFRENTPVIETGDSLGDLTDELEGDYIVKWDATGPKSYSYTTFKGKMVCKVKGFTLNFANSQVINQTTMRNLVEGEISSILVKRENAITRDALTKCVVNKDQTKTFSCGYNKRVVLENYDTIPYGN